MPRLRRTACTGGAIPIAAEVLEVRSLLSAASAAVHHALAAEQLGAGARVHQPATSASQLTAVGATVQSTTNGDVSQFSGNVMYAPVPPKIGAHLTFYAGFVVTTGGVVFHADIALKGTIQKLTPVGATEVATLKATGTLSEGVVGFPKAGQIGKTNGTPLTVTFDLTGKFLSFETTFALEHANVPTTSDILVYT
jgi:hypothetical protein